MHMVYQHSPSHPLPPVPDQIQHLQHWISVLQGVVEAMQQLLDISDFDTALTRTLQILGQATAVDRIYLFENMVCSETCIIRRSPFAEWISSEEKMAFAPLPWQDFAEFTKTEHYHRLAARKSVYLRTAEYSAVAQQKLALPNVRSMLLLPIFTKGSFWGYLGLESFREERVWDSDTESLLMSVAASMGNAIKQHQHQVKLGYDAFYDPLTQLPNRALLLNRLEQLLKQTKRDTETLFALLFIDLDRFKVINDSLGHAVGDQLLVAIAHRLASIVRPGDTVSRLGGDEFVVLLNPIQNVADATSIVERFQVTLAQPFEIAGHSLKAEMSIGIVVSNQGQENAADFLQQADRAMYRAKGAGKGCYRVFDPDTDAEAIALAQLETEMGKALQQKKFEVYYQPIIHLSTGRIEGFEALLRWYHHQRGWISPDLFIPLAEETGMIHGLGEFVLRQSCAQMLHWQRLRQNQAPLTLNVNLSVTQLQQPDFSTTVARILRQEQFNPQHLRFELTESIALEQDEFAVSMLNQLKIMGIQLHLDDFGVGYSCLNYLYILPFSVVKLDRLFIQRLGLDEEGLELVRTMVNIANILGMDIIAEGIETQFQLDMLHILQCSYGQGYWYSPPVNFQQAESLLLASC
jgi:diguanylate cyclase (GGDEF)-like protein